MSSFGVAHECHRDHRALAHTARELVRVVVETLCRWLGMPTRSSISIARRRQLSKGTIMYHFGSKDQMLREMSLGYMERRLRELEVIVEELTDDSARLGALIVSLVTSYRDDRESSIAFSREFMRFANGPGDGRGARAAPPLRSTRCRASSRRDGGRDFPSRRREDRRAADHRHVQLDVDVAEPGRAACRSTRVAAVFASTTLSGVLATPGDLQAGASSCRRRWPSCAARGPGTPQPFDRTVSQLVDLTRP